MLKTTFFDVRITGTHSVVLPEMIIADFISNKMKRVRCVARFQDQQLEFHAALQKYHGRYQLMFSKQKQQTLKISSRDIFQLQLLEDTSKYGVEMPEELEAVLLTDYDAMHIFESLTDGKKRSIIYTILRYKNPQTRVDKALLLCENLKRGVRNNLEFFKPL